MPLEIDLIERGYFPREVPPPFVTSSLASHAESVGIASLSATIGAKWWTASARHNLARPGGLRRPLSIPNPIGFLQIANETGGGWVSELEPLLVTANMSASRPILSGGPRAVQSIGANTIELRRAEARRSSRIILHTDIQNFYPTDLHAQHCMGSAHKACGQSRHGKLCALGQSLR